MSKKNYTSDFAPILVSIQVAADALSIDRSTLYPLLDRPDGIPTVRLGARRLVKMDSLKAYVSQLGAGDNYE